MSLRDYLSNGIATIKVKRSKVVPAAKPEAARGDDDLMSSDPHDQPALVDPSTPKPVAVPAKKD